MIIIVFLSLPKFMQRFLESTLWKLVKEIQSSALSIITLAMSCNHLTNKFIPIVFFLQSVHASLSCKCTDGPLSQHCKVLSYFKRFSLATTWMDATQQFSQTPNSFSSFKKNNFSTLKLHSG